jgi:hypothetical protein
MRNATILVVNFRGVATETIKNIVLAGIGKLIIWDCEDVAAEDLGAGFFFRDEDVGKKVRFRFLLVLLYCTSLTANGLSRQQPVFASPLLPPPLPCRLAPTCGELTAVFHFTARGCGEGSYREPQPACCSRDYDVSVRAGGGRVRRGGAGRGPGVHNRLGPGFPCTWLASDLDLALSFLSRGFALRSHRYGRMTCAEGRESRCTRGVPMASSVTYFAICWSMSTSLRTCFFCGMWRTLVEGSVLFFYLFLSFLFFSRVRSQGPFRS